MTQNNLFDFDIPGIYKIVCSKTNCIYYGQTSCFLRRSFQHLQLLKENSHSCLKWQNDFNCYSQNSFYFEIILIEKLLSKRLKIEKDFILNAAEKSLYNPVNQTRRFNYQPRVAQQIQIDDIVYPSIAEAARQVNQSSRTIRKKLDNPINKNYQRLHVQRNSYFDEYQVIIAGKIYPTTSNVVECRLAETTRQVRDRCRSKKWHNWILVEKMSNDYPNRE